jgi:hypothetical protein
MLLQMLDYNVPHGKLNRGTAVADAVEAIKGKAVSLPIACVLEEAYDFRGKALFCLWQKACFFYGHCGWEGSLERHVNGGIADWHRRAVVASASMLVRAYVGICVWGVGTCVERGRGVEGG